MKPSYPPRLSLAQTPTPFYPLARLSADIGGPRIWIKRDDMTGCAVSGNKIRKLEFTLARAMEQGCDTIITAGGVQSNHCRTTAVLCAQLGLRCHLILRGSPDAVVDGNLLLDRLVGADISFYGHREYAQRERDIFQEISERHVSRGRKPYTVPIGASDATGLWGYIAACEELQRDFENAGIAPLHIVCATGSGGTQGGLTAGSALFELGASVWGVNVCDDEAYFINKVGQDLRDWHTEYASHIDAGFDVRKLWINVIDGYVGEGYGVASAEVFECIERIARLEGVILDPVYTGKAFYGLLGEIDRGRFDDSEDIVFIHTGGLFGLFPQKDHLLFERTVSQ